MTATWPQLKLKHVANVAFSSVDKKRVEGEVPVKLCNYTDVYYNDDITAELGFMDATATPEEATSFSLEAGDILLTKDSETPEDIGVPAFVRRRIEGVICGYHLAMVRPYKHRVVPSFLFWSLASQFVQEQFSVIASGVTRFGLRLTDMRNTRLYLPPLEQQRAVADFLDRETARIDQLVVRRRELGRLSELRRNALRANAVAGRLGKSAQIAATGIVALPELPRGWDAVRLKNATTEITVGVVVTPAAFYAEEGLPFIRGYNVRPGMVNDQDLARISTESNALHPKSILRPADVLVVRTGQTGAAAVCPSWAIGGNCVDVLIVRCAPSLRPKFLELVLNSEQSARQIQVMSVGAIQSHLNVGALRDLVVPVPPLNEQDAVIQFVKEQEEEMNRLMGSVNRQIALLHEHRQALITAAVTGQMDGSSQVA